jgi:uncharacterized protein YndB with AHSA1/START domain
MTQAALELVIERHIAAPPEKVFQIWTERLTEWWAPKPWVTEIIEQDYRPGGRSALRMTGPEGGVSEMEGVVLEFIPNRSIVFTEGGGEMNDSRTVVGGDELGSHNAPAIGAGRGSQRVERALVAPTNEI